MSELLIRKAVTTDLPEIEQLENQCFETPWSIESLDKDINGNKLSLYIVAELAGHIVGYIGVWNIIDECHINNVAVSPVYRRQHIGTVLVETLVQSVSAAGINKFTLEVRAGNEPAKKLYQKTGFVENGLRKGYYEDNGEDAIIMWRK